MGNPFQNGMPQQAPVISDVAAQQFAPQAPPMQQDAYQAATQYPTTAPAPQAAGIPGQAWTPEQHQAYGQAQGQPGYAPAPQQAPAQAPYGYQPMPATPQPTDPAAQFAAHAAYQQNPAQYQTHQQFAQQQAPQGYAPAPQQAPAAPAVPQQQFQQAGVPTFAQQPGTPAFAQPGTQTYGVDTFSNPSAGGVGRRPGWRDLRGRLVLVRVTARDVERETYDKKGKEKTLDANLVVLDGGQIVMSPKMGDPTSVAEVFSDTTPCVIDGMIVTSKGMQNRLKADFVKGRVVREPINDLGKMLKDVPGSEPLWLKLENWLAQDPSRVHDFKQSIMWSIVEDNSEQATQMAAAFLQTPEGQAFCR